MKYIVLLIILIALYVGYKSDSKQFIPLVLTAIVAIGGWFIAHQLSVERDRHNKQRDLRIEYLISAYRRLANASMRPPQPGSQYFREMESAMEDIQLFGTESQINQANTFMDEFHNSGMASMDVLLNNLRNDLREEMNLSKVRTNVKWFRPEGAPDLEREQSNEE